MANEKKTKRKEIIFFEGVNSFVGDNIGKKQELAHVENARSKVIGTIEKRQGTRRLGNDITATDNFAIFYFENDGSTNNGFFRISTVSSATNIYYLNSSANWTALSGSGASIFEMGDSTTQFDITNPTGDTHRYTYDTNGTDPDIDAHITVGTIVVTNAQNFAAGNNGTFTVTGVGATYFEVDNSGGVVESNKTIGTGSITVTGNKFDYAIAESVCFLVNGDNDNMYISSDGSTIVTSTTASGHLYNSPKARKINFYKDRLYIADYTSVGVRYKTGIMMSSMPLGIASLVDGDHASGITTLQVTDTKYIHTSDSLDVYRGAVKILTLTVTAKTENSLTVNATGAVLNSSDEIWIADTYNGTRVFRWADNPASGIDAKKYDTFKLTGNNQNDRIKMLINIGNVMLIGNDSNLAVWDNYELKSWDLGIGCVGDKAFAKAYGSVFFIGWKGLYSTNGQAPKLLTSKIQAYFDGATKAGLRSGAVGIKGLSVLAYIGDVTLYNKDGSVDKVLSDVVIEYDIRQNNCFAHVGIKSTEFATYVRSTNVDSLQFSSTETGYPIFELFNNQVDDYVTSNKAIPFRMDTHNITLSSEFEKICYPMHINVEMERGSGLLCFISLDNEPWYQIEGEARKGATIFNVTSKDEDFNKPPRCRQIRVSLRDFTKKLCKISKMAILYRDTEETEEPHRN